MSIQIGYIENVNKEKLRHNISALLKEQDVFQQFLESELAKEKYNEYLKENNETEKDFPFTDWIEGFIDEYGVYAFFIKTEDWEKENTKKFKFKRVK